MEYDIGGRATLDRQVAVDCELITGRDPSNLRHGRKSIVQSSELRANSKESPRQQSRS